MIAMALPTSPPPRRPGKTHGRWFTPNGDAAMLESGKGGQYYDAARQRSVELGPRNGRRATSV
ncbi:hypothetical protein BJ970_003640 [Saccharopolyspora phatthalungensis]|uniref:Uncharacterized protein n=1 Tax=Saccharopolyspora phatthalungensis TaxID=664693 RepID=A0A840Q6L1_9PSEU|nr:hypothetical protein [Saccharopolyspora phatthalungensis]